MRCYLIRHAHTVWNGENRIQGHADSPLSPVGLPQAQCLGRYFARRPIRALYTSHLTRSQQTAQAIADSTSVLPTIERDFSEIHFGAWEGLTSEEVNARYQDAYRRWLVAPSLVEIPGAESLEMFFRRVRTAMNRVIEGTQEGDEVAIVSHGGVIAALLADALGASFDQLLRRLRLDNAGITAVDYRDGTPSILWVNDTTHLNHLQPHTTPDRAATP